MRKLLTVAPLALFTMLVAGAAAAQDAVVVAEPISFSGIGLGMIILGAALGIGWIGSSAVSAIARQPEAKGDIQTNMIIPAALIEGATVIALVFMLIV